MTTYPPPPADRWTADYLDLKTRLGVVEQLLAAGDGAYGAFPCLSTTHPASPKTGAQILETDTGLTAYWSGTAWIYPPQLITSVVLGASATSVLLPPSGSIPQVFRNLRLIVSAKSSGTTAGSLDPATLQLNGIATGYNWSSIQLAQGGAAVTVPGGSSATAAQCMQVWNNLHTSQGRGISEIRIPNYSDTTAFKSFTAQSEATDGGSSGGMQVYAGGLNNSSAAVTTITIAMTVGQFLPGTGFWLYGE